MVAAIVVSPASGSIISKKTAVNVSVTGAASNTATGYDSAKYPASPQVAYYFKAALAGQDSLKSYPLAVDSAGAHTFPSVIFPAAGSWTVTINRVSDDGVAATDTVVVS